MTKVKDLHDKWMKSGEYRKAHEALASEFALAHAVIEARVTAGLTQEQLAQRMKVGGWPQQAFHPNAGTIGRRNRDAFKDHLRAGRPR